MVFEVRRKYGLNKMDEAEFRRDQLTNELFSLALSEALYLILTWILEQLPAWTNHYSVGYGTAFLVMTGIAALLIVFMTGASFLSWKILRMKYHFTDLEEGKLRSEIEALVKDSRHKVRRIEVYDESKKSTSKNAFVVRLPFFRSIGIADNFLNENSERELLAVLAHEAGHLKHRKDLRNFIGYGIWVLLFFAGVFAILYGARIVGLEDSLNRAFGLAARNTVLSVSAAEYLFSPLFWLFSVYMNYVSRCEEYEADRNAVKEGYGLELIDTFRTISNDELVDVNPDALAEAIEFDHPGMANRIAAIQRAIEAQKS
jgi:Zn-dependent protease with chaperone function